MPGLARARRARRRRCRGCCSCLTRQVDAHRQRRVERELRLHDPAWRQASRRTQRPIGTIRPVSSASGMKLSGCSRPRSGAASAPAPRARRSTPSLQAHDRLVVQLELAGRDRALQVGLQLEAREHDLVHRGLEHPVAALAVALGDVHGGVGVADQVVGVGGAAVPGHGDAEARAHDRAPCWPSRSGSAKASRMRSAASDGLLEARPRPRAGPRTRRRRSGPPCRSRGRTLRVAWPRRSSTWSPAAWPRLSLIVLKSSRSRKMTASPSSSRRVPRDRVPHPVDEQRAVGEARHRVVEGLVRELLLEDLALADVAAVQHDAVARSRRGAGSCAGSRTAAGCRRGGAARTRCVSPSRPPCSRSSASSGSRRALLAGRAGTRRSGGPPRPRPRSRARARSRGSGRAPRAWASITVIRSLACCTSELRRASLVRCSTSSVSAALSSASDTWVASACSELCTGREALRPRQSGSGRASRRPRTGRAPAASSWSAAAAGRRAACRRAPAGRRRSPRAD